MIKKLRCAVIGVGYLGRFHAQKYNILPQVELVGVCDIHAETAHRVATELNTQAYTQYQDLFGKVDAVSIAATTKQHFELTRAFLTQGIHVLIEKPMTEIISEAEALIALAKTHQVILQVGHLERFNAATLALTPYLHDPVFIESNRLAPYNPRGADVNVVLDLMIHDIDLIQSIVKSPIAKIDAQGAPVLSPSIDIANARIAFENNCVANVTASRVSFKSERKMRIFQRNNYLSVDFQNKEFAVFEKGDGELFPGIPDVKRHQATIEKNDALLEEIKAFVHAIEHQTTPCVTGEDGLAALKTASLITDCIHQHLAKHDHATAK